MAKVKTWRVWSRTRSALRLIYRNSPMRKAAIAAAVDHHFDGNKYFTCRSCGTRYPIQMADVDHAPPCGPLLAPADLPGFFDRLMNGTVRVVCKLCHNKTTASQRSADAKIERARKAKKR